MQKITANTETPISGIVMGFDFGMKRIGIALGQTVTLTARPLQTIAAKDGIPNWDELSKVLKKWQPNALVVGIPLNMDGSEQKVSLNARQFVLLIVVFLIQIMLKQKNNCLPEKINYICSK